MKHFYTLAFALSLGLAACGGKSSSSGGGGDTTVATGPTCADVGANMAAQMKAEMPDVPPEVVDQAADVASTSCTEDGWSAEAMKCFAEMQGDSAASCESTLTAEQQDGLGRRLGEMLNAGGGEPMPEEGVEGGEAGGGDW